MSRASAIVAPIACLAAGLALSLAVAVGVSAVFFPVSGASVDIAAGEALFRDRCAGCHSIAPGASGGLGPSLARIGIDGDERREGMGAEAYVLESILYPDAYHAPGAEGQMPRGTAAGASDRAVLSLVAYLVGRSATPDFSTLLSLRVDADALEPEERIRSDLAELRRGHELFSESLGCAGCHSILGLPGSALRAPSLAKASQLSPRYLSESIRRPSARISPGYRRATLALDDGRTVGGRLMREGESDLELLVENGANGRLERMRISRERIDEITVDPRSIMPSYELSPQDERALIAFLKFLSGST